MWNGRKMIKRRKSFDDEMIRMIIIEIEDVLGGSEGDDHNHDCHMVLKKNDLEIGLVWVLFYLKSLQ